MSFILDALKKSESDRQRQSGPALFEVKVAPPKTRFPVWAIAIAVLLVINLSVVGWMLLRRPAQDSAAQANQPAPGAGQQAPAAQQGAAQQTPAQQTPAQQTPAQQTPAQQAPAQQAPAQQASTGPAAPPPQPAPQQSAGPQGPAAQQSPGQPPTLNQSQPQPSYGASAAASVPTEPQTNPDDYAPATEPGSPLFKGHVKRGTEEGLPLYQDAATAPGAKLPELRLDLHVYAAKPQDRFALINMHKMHEGDTLVDGTRVDSITPDGVILSRNGSRFLLPRD